MNFDKQGGFITIPDDYVVFTKKDGEKEDEATLPEGVKMIRDLQEVSKGID